MIVLYGKFYVKNEFNIEKFLEKSVSWVHGMRNLPKTFRNFGIQRKEMDEVREESNFIQYAIDNDQKLASFCVKLEDENSELWKTDLVLQENQTQGVMQIRLAREQRRATSEQNKNFRLPWILRHIIGDGYGGDDNGLQVIDSPIFIDTNAVEMGKRIIDSPDTFIMPIVYVSKTFYTNEYLVDVDQLAKDLAGIAHVVAETDSLVASRLKELVEEKNPYNGAIGIYYGKDDFIRLKREAWVSNNQFRWKISHSIYNRMAMLNIPEEYSFSFMRSNILLKQLQDNSELNEKDRRIQELEIQLERSINDAKDAKQELNEYIETFGTKEKEVFDLEAKVQYYQSVLDRQETSRDRGILLNYTEKDFYPDEVRDVVLELLDKAGQNIGEDGMKRRSFHIMQDIKNSNAISKHREEMIQRIREILEKGNANSRTLADLQKMGFDIKGKEHIKIYYHGDGRYMITLASTPSEYRGSSNTAHNAIDLMFK